MPPPHQEGAQSPHKGHPLSTWLWCPGEIELLRPTAHLQNKATPARLGEVADLPNTGKQTQRVRQNKDTEEYVSHKRRK